MATAVASRPQQYGGPPYQGGGPRQAVAQPSYYPNPSQQQQRGGAQYAPDHRQQIRQMMPPQQASRNQEAIVPVHQRQQAPPQRQQAPPPRQQQAPQAARQPVAQQPGCPTPPPPIALKGAEQPYYPNPMAHPPVQNFRERTAHSPYHANMRAPPTQGPGGFVRDRHVIPSQYWTPQMAVDSFLFPNAQEPGLPTNHAPVQGQHPLPSGWTNNTNVGSYGISDEMNLFAAGPPPRQPLYGAEVQTYQLMPDNWRPGNDFQKCKDPQCLDDYWDRFTICPEEYQHYISTGGQIRLSVIDRVPNNPIKGMVNSDLRCPASVALDSNRALDFLDTDMRQTLIAESTGFYPVDTI